MSDEKLCSKCQQVKKSDDFAKSRKPDGLQAWCRECKKVDDKQYYQDNKDKYLKYNRERYGRLSVFLDEIKSKPCTDCGGVFPPCAMDFDHLDGREKLYDVGNAKMRSMEKLMTEIAKCELVCANCHRVRTYNRNKERKQAPLV